MAKEGFPIYHQQQPGLRFSPAHSKPPSEGHLEIRGLTRKLEREKEKKKKRSQKKKEKGKKEKKNKRSTQKPKQKREKKRKKRKRGRFASPPSSLGCRASRMLMMAERFRAFTTSGAAHSSSPKLESKRRSSERIASQKSGSLPAWLSKQTEEERGKDNVVVPVWAAPQSKVALEEIKVEPRHADLRTVDETYKSCTSSAGFVLWKFGSSLHFFAFTSFRENGLWHCPTAPQTASGHGKKGHCFCG